MERGESMARTKNSVSQPVSCIHNASELGKLIRLFRVSQHFTLEKVSGMTNIGMRFLSELERGKETAQLGKVLQIINQLGLEVVIQARGYHQRGK